MLDALIEALDADPFADPVHVWGVVLSRRNARELERELLRARVASRRSDLVSIPPEAPAGFSRSTGRSDHRPAAPVPAFVPFHASEIANA